MKVCCYFLYVLALVVCGRSTNPAEETSSFWQELGEEELRNAIGKEDINKNVAKNVIIFIGDGMSMATVTAARILKGQLQGRSGEESKLAMDKFNHVGLSKTYAVDKQVSDSASTATAYLCGVKTNDRMLGLTAAARLDNCSSTKPTERNVDSVLVDAFKVGKSAGIVTTTRITHATPAGAYAHSASRNWYCDADLPQEAKDNQCKDIAQQFIDSSHMFKVVLGGGRKHFQPQTSFDPEYTTSRNEREDGQDLIEQWREAHKTEGLDGKYVWNKAMFDAVDPDTTDALLGLFERSDMQYESDRLTRDGAGEPSIAEMTGKAIQMLRKNSDGFFLLVEGGRIDHAHHAGNAHLALHDTLAFDDAVAKAVELTSESDTLIIVTADHSHTLTMGGYSARGNSIFGLAPSDEAPRTADDGKPFTTLLYANGPGYALSKSENATCRHVRDDLTSKDLSSRDYRQQAAVPLGSETHGGDDVAIVARGPMAHLFHGVHEQSYIASVMRYASCVGPNKSHCKSSTPTSSMCAPTNFLGMTLLASEAETGLYVLFVLLIFFVLISCMSCLVLRKYQNRSARKSTARNGEDGRML